MGFIGQIVRKIIGTDFKFAQTADEVTSKQILSQDESKLGEEVYALYLDAIPKFKKWWDYIDRCELYYRGEARPESRGKNRTNANHNIVFSDIETIKPTIRANLINPVLYAETKDGYDAGRKLNLRTENIWRDSEIRGEQQELTLTDILVGGTTYFKTLYDKKISDIRSIRIDSRRILFDIACRGDLSRARWVMDVTETTPAAMNEEFQKRVLEAGVVQLESDKSRPDGPTPVGSASSSGSSSIAEQGSDVIIYGSKGTENEKAFSDKVERAIKIEVWIWDLTKNDDGSLKYPVGRRVTAAVGLSKKGKATDSTRPETVILEDIQNPCEQIAKQLHEFPIVQIQCHNLGQILGISEASGRGDLQDLVNDALNQLHDNWRYNNSPVRVVHKRFGLTAENVRNAPDNVIVIDAPVEDVRKAIHFDRPHSMADEAIRVLSFYISLNEQGGGAADVMAGRISGGESGIAISQLQNKAQGRFQTIAKSVNNGYRKVYRHEALMAQDYDTQYGKKIELINEQAEHDKPDERYVEYDPSETQNVKIRMEVSRKLSVEETQGLIQAAMVLAQNAGDPALAELLLAQVEDKSLLLQWRELMRAAAEKAEKEQQTKIAADSAKQRQDAAKRLSVKALDVIQSRRNNGKGNKGS